MMHRMLEKLGYQVTSFNSVIKGLDAFKAAPEEFDLIITDMTMPKMTGDKLAQEVIQIKPDVPVIICTGFSEKMNWEKATALGIKGVPHETGYCFRFVRYDKNSVRWEVASHSKLKPAEIFLLILYISVFNLKGSFDDFIVIAR